MFVRYTTEVPIPLADVEKRLDNIRAHLEQWADVAYREGEQLTARVGPTEQLAKKIQLDLGPGEVHRRGLVYPMTWTAIGAQALFPRLTADLILSHDGAYSTRISLEGTYKPPLGAVGRMVDRVALGRVAESAVRSWVDRVVAALVKSHRARLEER